MADCDIAVSIVTYETDGDVLSRCIESVFNADLSSKLCIIDNSTSDKLKGLCEREGIDYVFRRSNIGYGAGHNIAIEKTIRQKTKYHLGLNPDIYFEKGTIEDLYDFMENNRDVGLTMPKILYPDGSIQYLCKLLPTPLDLIGRRFLPSLKYLDRRNHVYELRFTGYDKTMDVPYLSGCFMFVRTEALREVGLFDERFFVYMEDVDLSRRIHRHFRTVYYPAATVYHRYEKGSYKSATLLAHHLLSAIKYFNKWGYVFDKERRDINERILKHLLPDSEASQVKQDPLT
ncbi:MAG: glycosyltransferase family 2 protein [Planctomycetota bacterium]|jgi:GT2 family glycosyltransferase